MKINIAKLKKFLKKAPEILAAKALLFLVVAILIDLVFGALTFYQYSFLAQQKEIEITDKSLMLKEELLPKILGELEQRENRFKETESKTYPDLFHAPRLTE